MKTFSVLVKPIGSICNLRCKYCFYLEKELLYQDSSSKKMSFQILEEFIKQYINALDIPLISFGWQGGEPTLMGIDFYRKAVELQIKYSDGKKIENTFQTNGILLNDEWCHFFVEYNFLIGISIDGPKDINDYYRLDSKGISYFSKIRNNLSLMKKHGVEFNTLTTVNKINSEHPLKVYNFLKEIDSHYLQFIPIVDRIAINSSDSSQKLVLPEYARKCEIATWSSDPLKYGDFLIQIFDEWVKKDVGKYFIQTFDTSLASWYGIKPGLCVFNEICGDAIVLEHNGNLYACDHYVYPEYYLGNILNKSISELVNFDKQIEFGQAKKNKLAVKCKECEFLFACNGGCPKHRIIESMDNKINYFCDGYKLYFEHINPYMEIMVNELHNNRPPANIMNMIQSKNNINQYL